MNVFRLSHIYPPFFWWSFCDIALVNAPPFTGTQGWPHTQIPRAYDTGLSHQSIKGLSTVINSGIGVTQPSQREPWITWNIWKEVSLFLMKLPLCQNGILKLPMAVFNKNIYKESVWESGQRQVNRDMRCRNIDSQWNVLSPRTQLFLKPKQLWTFWLYKTINYFTS